MPQHFGWVDRPREVERFLAGSQRPLFGVSAAAAGLSDNDADVYLWDNELELYGRTLPAFDQQIGDCVSMAWARGAMDVNHDYCVQLRNQGDVYASGQIATEPIYALSRVEIGGGRIGGDGSTGAWAARAVTSYGVLLRIDYGSIDLTHYSGTRARQWGRSGCPDELEPLAKQTPISEASMVVSWEEFGVALSNRMPVPICSNQGFATVRQSKTGICRPEGSWAHCMLFRGRLLIKGNRPVGVCQQSWGNSPTGPDLVELESGETLTLPQGCFNVDAEIVDRMLRGWRDSYAMVGFRGFAPPPALQFGGAT